VAPGPLHHKSLPLLVEHWQHLMQACGHHMSP